mmetsp:Transcript_102522/g.328467  ORF Transcript_102522/g.328467 Transcript_102522/m.328467 type:complete len:716 (-) Transcript_102522:300-2447(-)
MDGPQQHVGGSGWRQPRNSTQCPWQMQQNGGDDANRDVRDLLHQCKRWGLLDEACRPRGDSVMKLLQWQGDAVLGLKARTLVHEKRPDGDLAMKARWSSLSVTNSSLEILFNGANLQSVLGGDCLFRKQKADRMEAIIFELNRLKEEPFGEWWKVQFAKDGLIAIMEALLAIGWSRMQTLSGPGFGDPREDSEDCQSWLKYFECEKGDHYTHSSLRGGRDWTTASGQLDIPDTPEIRVQLEKMLIKMFHLARPLCWVEMSTPHYPFYEDIDVMGGNCAGPPADLLNKRFWLLRAEILHELFPDVDQFELTLYKAHGYQKEKGCFKASFHAVWPKLVVDRARANAVRLATLARFDQESARGNEISDTQRKLLQADERNTWDAIFDKASVQGGSFRMPFCDKIYRGSLEGRPILPDSVWRFGWDCGCIWYHLDGIASDLSDAEWSMRGRVRLAAEPSGLPALTRWKPPRFRGTKLPKQSSATSSSLRSWAERHQTKQEKEVSRWETEQRARRRQWSGPAIQLKEKLDESMGDPAGHESTWVRIQAKEGRSRWCWTSRRLKGAVEVEEPTGEVFLRGSTENQAFLLEMVRDFTDEFRAAVPAMSAKAKQRLFPGSQGAGSTFPLGSGKGGQKGATKGWQKGVGRLVPDSRVGNRNFSRGSGKGANKGATKGWQNGAERLLPDSQTGGRSFWKGSSKASRKVRQMVGNKGSDILASECS